MATKSRRAVFNNTVLYPSELNGPLSAPVSLIRMRLTIATVCYLAHNCTISDAEDYSRGVAQISSAIFAPYSHSAESVLPPELLYRRTSLLEVLLARTLNYDTHTVLRAVLGSRRSWEHGLSLLPARTARACDG